MLSTTVIYAAIAALSFAGDACGFTGSIVGGGRVKIPLEAVKQSDDAGTSKSTKGGAGSWRSKAQEFLDSPEGFDGGDEIKTLNIAFVVSTSVFLI